ncbi:MAG: DASH family cryptochrome [Bacteroidetes bacterium]|nr:DASH family cryptochrome [Bacteroidota bacterium]
MKRAIVWFKTDLRLHDNETLVQAISNNDEIIPVYCIDDAHFKTTEFGFKKTGNHRAQFILESLQDLDQNLRELGSGLIVVKGKPEIKLLELVNNYQVQKVYAKKEVAYEELQTQELVEQELWKVNCQLEVYSTSTLYHAQDLPFPLRDIPDVFTTFRKRVEKESQMREVYAKPETICSPEIPQNHWPSLEELGSEKIVPDSRAAIQFKGGETSGINRLKTYLYETKAISNYKETRNGMIGENYSSKFSAWLSLGCLSTREIYHEIKKYEEKYTANESTYWLIFELIWRDYFRFMMKKYRHQFFLQNGIKTSTIELNKNNPYFEQQLIDYDVCSNWGNWAYLAGVGNDPRGKRVFNIERQADEYDKNQLYRNLWLGKI